MIGVFDSGVGGISAYRHLRRYMPERDIVYLADSKNAPYGTKTEDEILKFTKNNIRILSNLGCEAILIACCSASTVYNRLNEKEREIALPIISPSARLAAESGRRITVIATRHTASSGAFGREIGRFSDARVCEMAEQGLVALVESGNRDGKVRENCKTYLTAMTERIKESDADTLILGCTHFSHLEGEIRRLLPDVRIINPARVGAEEMIKKIKKCRENGRSIYI